MADSVSTTRDIGAPAAAIFAVLADPASHAADRRHRLGPRAPRPRSVDRPGSDLPHVDVPRDAPRRVLRGGQPGPGGRSPSAISWDPGSDAVTAHCSSAAGPGATTSRRPDPRTPRSRSPMTGRPYRTTSASSSDSRRSLPTIWTTRWRISTSWSTREPRPATHRPGGRRPARRDLGVRGPAPRELFAMAVDVRLDRHLGSKPPKRSPVVRRPTRWGSRNTR